MTEHHVFRASFAQMSERFQYLIFTHHPLLRPVMASLVFRSRAWEEEVPLELFTEEDWRMLRTYLFFNILGFPLMYARIARIDVRLDERTRATEVVHERLAKECPHLLAALCHYCNIASSLYMDEEPTSPIKRRMH